MATYEISGFASYQVNTTNTDTFFEGTTVQNFTFDDGNGAGDMFFSENEIVATVSGEQLPYLGTLNVDMVGGGTMELALVQGAASFVDPNIIQVLIVVPDYLSVSDFNFPQPIVYDSRSTDDFATCFAAGTLIATPDGETAVEALCAGDLVTTAKGRAVPVKWIGRQTRLPFFSGAAAAPVRIKAGALGDGLPHNDLTVTGDHGMILDGLVINASALVNGTTIDWVPMTDLPDRVTYYHIETEEHDVIVANGAAAETFIDYVSRQKFDNYAEYVDLFGDDRTIVEMPLPRISAARLVPQSIRDRLNIHAQTFPIAQAS
ncbi:Hint domain-containing protein [Roseovarius confluentis]|uniref:Hint domain-containing protein n=1 Tax=Roseovarius confluentis TaxID=1852027 RepID=UPI001FE42D81|nr:Hint domain-containing protein [Roseovarius confluentis]